MASILDVIASETHGSSFKTYKYGFDGIEVPRFDYDDHQDGLLGLPIQKARVGSSQNLS